MISIIIPAFNAENTIADCLDSLLDQTIDRERYEIILVDDGSTDETPNIAKRYSEVRLLTQDNQGPASARNKGARHAKGDIILFTDADCRAAGDWLEQMTGPFNGHSDIVGVKGLYKTKQKGVIARFVQLEYEDKYDLMRKEQYIDFIDTYSAGFRKKIFLEMDGYDTNFPVACAEDVDLSYRLANDGYKMTFVPEAVVYHSHPDTLKDYLKKKFKFACWRILAVKKSPNKVVKDSHTPQIMKFQVVLVPLIFLSIIVGLGLRLYSVPIVVILIYFATTIPFTIKAIEKDIIVGLLSPFLLLARSLAQFWGILCGLVKLRA